jgi:hypothetical protein
LGTIRFVKSSGPGVRKARGGKLLTVRRAVLAKTHVRGWGELFEKADVVSEGSVRSECDGTGRRTWYGTTSVILLLDEEREAHAAVARTDLHVRLRAVRAATREATLRAPAPLGEVSCEINVAEDARGVRIDVEVQAPLIEGARGAEPAD